MNWQTQVKVTWQIYKEAGKPLTSDQFCDLVAERRELGEDYRFHMCLNDMVAIGVLRAVRVRCRCSERTLEAVPGVRFCPECDTPLTEEEPRLCAGCAIDKVCGEAAEDGE